MWKLVIVVPLLALVACTPNGEPAPAASPPADEPSPPIATPTAEPTPAATPTPPWLTLPEDFGRQYESPSQVDRGELFIERLIMPDFAVPGDPCVAPGGSHGSLRAGPADLAFQLPGQFNREHFPSPVGPILVCEVEQPVFVPGVLIDGWPVRTGG